MLRPWNVFTPGKLPLKPENVYARRASVESALTKAFQRGKVPVVFGEYGVGKTSTVRKFVQEIGDNKHLVNIESVAKKRFEDIVAALLESVGFEVQLTSTQTASSSATKQLSGGLGKWGLAIGGMRGQQTDSSSALTAAKAVTSPTDSRVLAVCEEHGLQLVIDELHKATDDFKEDLANFVKAFGNRSCDRFRIYLVGTANDVIELVQVDEGIDRLLDEVRMGAMTDDEARFVVEAGMEKLAITIDREHVDAIVSTSVGSPSVLQHLALEVAEQSFDRAGRTVTHGDLKDALRSYVKSNAYRLNDAYMKAIETTGEKRYRKQILRAVAELADEYVTMDQIRGKVSVYLEEEVGSPALSGPLRQLKEDELGGVLRDVQRNTGKRVYNLTSFSDPAMKAFVRMRCRAEERGVWDPQEELPL